ncbi:protein CFAP20DC-like [Sceloporus undulatus]|uniref:protein CFAP20DC-like n=1 Tax=Sceloporus undulatus TaxID=8520 RepID=UPI001C4D990B|nr:protein CFAP20DC-like [Sceloporus undulatus]
MDTTDEDVAGPTDTIPRACQLNSDVPQVTQLLNMDKLRPAEQKCVGQPINSSELDHLTNRGSATIRNSKNHDISHIAFGSKVFGPPPPSGRRINTRASGEVTKSASIKTNRSCQVPAFEKGKEPIQIIGRTKRSPSPLDVAALEQGNKENIHCTNQMLVDQDEWVFPDKESSHLNSSNPLLMACETSYSFFTPPLNGDQSSENKQAVEDEQEDIFTYSSKPRSAPHGKPLNLSSESCSFVDLKEEVSGVWRGAQMEDDFCGNESNEEDNSYSEFMQEAQNSSFLSRSSELVISKEIPLKITSQSPENCASQGYAKRAGGKALSPSTEDSVVMTDEKADNIPRSLLPTCCSSPRGSIPGPSKETSEVSKDASSLLRTSISRKSLKEIPKENSNPRGHIPVNMVTMSKKPVTV